MSVAAIVVLAYGPGQVTKQAVERAQRLADPDTAVIVVPAVESAARFVRRLRGGRVAGVETPGRDGLQHAVAHLPEGAPILLVHDDVLVTADVLASLHAEHADSGAVAVPWNNDTQADTSIGSLPPARRAAPAVAAARGAAERAAVRRVRPSCLVATVGQVRRLLPMRVTVARTLLTPHGIDIVAAAGAVVAHDSTCVAQLAPPRAPDGRALVTAVMIVRDEEAMIGDCLASLDRVVDRIVVCDTGSTDDTVHIARAAGAEVIERDWRDDFGWARNEALEVARDSWYVLQVDADERLVTSDPVELRRQLATDVHDADALAITVRNLDADGRAVIAHAGVRLFRPDGVTYEGAIHEAPVRDGVVLGGAAVDGLHLDHLGYVRDVVAGRSKGERNVAIARQSHAQEATPVAALHLARSLLLLDPAHAEIPDLVAEALAGDLPDRARAHALALLAGTHLQDGEAAAARDRAREALELVPLDDEAGRIHAVACRDLEAWDDLLRVHAWRHTAPSTQPYAASMAARASELVAVAQAQVEEGDLHAAATTIRGLLDLGQALTPQTWLDVASVLVLHDAQSAADVLCRAATIDPSGHAIAAIARIFDAPDASRIIRAVVDAGNVTARTVQTGLALALVSEDGALLDALLPHADLVAPDVLDRVMQEAASRGQHDVAGGIARRLLAGAQVPGA